MALFFYFYQKIGDLGFLDFGFLDLLDIVLVAALLYYVYKLVRGTVAINIFIGIAIVYFIWKFTQALQMKLLSEILGQFIGVGVLALIIVFQQEIRKFLLLVGSTSFGSKKNFLRQLKFMKTEIHTKKEFQIVVQACEQMSKTKTGALIVFRRTNNLDFVKHTGDPMNTEVNQLILESIFYKNSPLHDGAVIIENHTITATRVILPLSQEKNIPSHFGLRHRAAIGITEKTDALCLVVSEETGQISYIKNGEFVFFEDIDQLVTQIRQDMS